MGITHHVFVASAELTDMLIEAEEASTAGDESWGGPDPLLEALLEMEDGPDSVDMWRLGKDVGDVLNVVLGLPDVFWAMGEYAWEMTYISPAQVADFAERLGTRCEPTLWYDAALSAGASLRHREHRQETERIVGDMAALVQRAAALSCGFIVWHSA